MFLNNPVQQTFILPKTSDLAYNSQLTFFQGANLLITL